MTPDFHCDRCHARSDGALHDQLARLSGCIDCAFDDEQHAQCEAIRAAILSELSQIYGPQTVAEEWSKVLRKGTIVPKAGMVA